MINNERIREEWACAKQENTLLSYFYFLDVYPHSVHSAEAKRRLDVLKSETIQKMRVRPNYFCRDEIYEYIVDLVEETRKNDMFSMGASPRGTIALLNMAKAMAVIDGRDFVTAEDVQSVTKDTLGHRVKLGQRARAQGMNMEMAIKTLVQTVKAPRT